MANVSDDSAVSKHYAEARYERASVGSADLEVLSWSVPLEELRDARTRTCELANRALDSGARTAQVSELRGADLAVLTLTVHRLRGDDLGGLVTSGNRLQRDRAR